MKYADRKLGNAISTHIYKGFTKKQLTGNTRRSIYVIHGINETYVKVAPKPYDMKVYTATRTILYKSGKSYAEYLNKYGSSVWGNGWYKHYGNHQFYVFNALDYGAKRIKGTIEYQSWEM